MSDHQEADYIAELLREPGAREYELELDRRQGEFVGDRAVDPPVFTGDHDD